MIYKLLAINVDGTLLRSNGRLQKKTKEAIEYVKGKGVDVTLVTNRHFLSTRKIAKTLKLTTPIVAFQGAMVAKSIDKPLFVERIPEEKTFNLVQVLENFDCTIRLFHERRSISSRGEKGDNILAKAMFQTNDPLYYPLQFVDSLGDYLRDEPISPIKIDVYFSKEREKRRAFDTITSTFEGITVYSNQKETMQIVSEGVSKLNGLNRVCSLYGYSLKEVVVIGDAMEDIPMIEQAGLGVAMGNAPFEVKKAADWVTRSNNELGVAYMIKEHFRKQPRIEFLQNMKLNN